MHFYAEDESAVARSGGETPAAQHVMGMVLRFMNSELGFDPERGQ